MIFDRKDSLAILVERLVMESSFLVPVLATKIKF